eukprot:15481762-Alexandrium_andersonii.AAC.1
MRQSAFSRSALRSGGKAPRAACRFWVACSWPKRQPSWGGGKATEAGSTLQKTPRQTRETSAKSGW